MIEQLLNAPRKVRNKAKVKGNTVFTNSLKSMIDETPKCRLVEIDQDVNGGYNYIIECATEDIASVLASLLRELNY